MELAGELVPVSQVTDGQRSEMYGLMCRYYAHMARELFELDLDEKQWVIRITDVASGALCGFSTQVLIPRRVDRRDVVALFSGDTIIDHRYWGRNPLAQVWGRFALSIIDAQPNRGLYWFLITKGYKTYRFLPLFFKEFYPRFDAPTPDWAASLTDDLAGAKFSSAYDPLRRVVSADSSACRLRSGVADITQKRLADPHVRFFVERNPGHIRGDELCCIAPLTRENFTPAAYRVIGTAAPKLEVTT